MEEADLGAKEEVHEDACSHKSAVLPPNLPQTFRYVSGGSAGAEAQLSVRSCWCRMLPASFGTTSGDSWWHRRDAEFVLWAERSLGLHRFSSAPLGYRMKSVKGKRKKKKQFQKRRGKGTVVLGSPEVFVSL